MQSNFVDLLRCVANDSHGPESACGGRLGIVPGGAHDDEDLRSGLLRCRRCSAVFPVLGGVPVLLPAPELWVARHRDAIVATLFEEGETSQTVLQVLDGMCRAAGPVPREPFLDDWTEDELAPNWPLPPSAATFGSHAFQTFLGEADKRRPEQLIAEWAHHGRRGRAGWIADVGCGTGVVARALAPHARRLILVDHSLRAVLRARRACRTATREPDESHGLVADASALPFRPSSIDVLVAAQLIDLLEDPEAMLLGAARCLRKRGRVIVSTPAIELAENDGALVRQWLAACGLAVTRRDTVPWVRAHDSRHYQVYFSEMFVAQPES